MTLYKITFGPVSKAEREQAEEIIENYISTFHHNGQTCGEYCHLMQQGNLCAYVNVAGPRALASKYHCKYGTKWLNEITAFFGHPPKWEPLADDAPKRDTTWTRARFLYLYTTMFDWGSPLCRGDNGKAIPLYRLPGAHEDREGIYFWQNAYRDYDSIWMRCNTLEIPVYKQLATPDSELSLQGREICKGIEESTGIPTYYFLMRHWGRRRLEEKRKCPGCGQPWHTSHATRNRDRFSQFAFQCKACRLVSHLANVDDDERHAVIGEWKAQKKKQATPRKPKK